jgi:hypothetical protein
MRFAPLTTSYALVVLDIAAEAFDLLKQADKAAGVRELQKQIREKKG